MFSKQQNAELRQFFAIRSDLAEALRTAVQLDIDHHLDELAIMQMHTGSERLRQACGRAIAGAMPAKVAANA